MHIFLAINWGGVGLQVAQLLLALSILVILHEFGHYITARWFKCRVEKFYLFFDPWFSIFKKKVGDTEYGIGWLPLGGYVKIAGMIDESLDKEQMKKPAESWEFRSKPAWQRLIIMLGGVTVNIILAFLIYAMILMVWGEKKIPTESMQYGIAFNDPIFKEFGFENGDKIISIDGEPVGDFNQALRKLIVVDEDVQIIRDGKEMTLKMPVHLIGTLVEKRKRSKEALVSPRLPIFVDSVSKGYPSYTSGLQHYDQILAINNAPAKFADQFFPIVENFKKGDTAQLTVMRSGEEVNIPVAIGEDGILGIKIMGKEEQLEELGAYKKVVTKYGFFAAFPAGVRKAGNELTYYIEQFGKILSPKTGAYKGVGGFKAMGSVFPDNTWNWEHFWTITAFFSIILAFMNLLPIPALDGGHVMFTLYEMITKRKPNEKFMEYAQVVGMVLLLGLMLYANGNDWFGWGK